MNFDRLSGRMSNPLMNYAAVDKTLRILEGKEEGEVTTSMLHALEIYLHQARGEEFESLLKRWEKIHI